MNEIERNFLWLMKNPLRRTKTIHREVKVGRNELCPCGSNRKAKHCCMLLQPLPLTELAKKEFEKERKSIMKSVAKEYKERTNGPST